MATNPSIGRAAARRAALSRKDYSKGFCRLGRSTLLTDYNQNPPPSGGDPGGHPQIQAVFILSRWLSATRSHVPKKITPALPEAYHHNRDHLIKYDSPMARFEQG
jgi:hypothetical protein